MSITIGTTAAALQQYCTSFDKQYQKTLRQGLEWEKELQAKRCDHTYVAKNADISDLLQPYQGGFTPNNTVTIDGVQNTLRHGKFDLRVTADDLEEFWDTHECNNFPTDKDPTQWDYVRWLFNELVGDKVMENINAASWHGVYQAPTPGTAGSYLQAWDGYAKKLADAITAGNVTPYVTGVLQANTMVDQVRGLLKSLPKVFLSKPKVVHMSTTNFQLYAEDYETKYPHRKTNTEDQKNPYIWIDHHNAYIKPKNGMEGSDRIIVTITGRDNMIWGTRKGRSIYPKWRFDSDIAGRAINVVAEISRFYGWKYYPEIFCNDQV